jgi:FMN phosphatase YigB (HAD superfamily)
LLYQQGYFRQVLDKDGAQQALYPYNDPGQLPITPLRQANGEWLRLEIDLPGYSVWMRAWQVQFGRVKLYLLDSNDAANFPAHRGITSELYVGGPELRLEQEILLGIGGLRLLGALGIQPEVCHLNEGHAAFAVLERAYSFMQETVQPFEVALSVTRAGNHFTTHTAVAAGFDRFTPALIEQYLGGYAEQKLGLEEYLSRTVFYEERPFTRDQFREFMVAQSQAFPEMIELVGKLKAKYGLKIAVVSNEGRELNTYRIRKFKLDGVVDFFVSSCFVHLRKPDSDIFRLALDIAQVPTEQIIYIENTLMFAQIVEGLGIRSILHTDYPSTCIQLASFGLPLDEGVSHDTR